MTWFRGMERRGCKIHWIDAMLPLHDKVELVKAYMPRKQENKTTNIMNDYGYTK